MRSIPFFSTVVAAGLVAGMAAAASPAWAATLLVLMDDGKLVRINSDTRQAMPGTGIRGADGRVVAIDVRPADGMLYGLTSTGTVVRIDPATGIAQQVSKLDKPLDTGARVAINFNPTVDRLRVIGINGANYRINVDTGAVTVDGTLKYQPGTPLANTTPAVTAAAYTNAYGGAKETMLYTLDTGLSQLNLQAPPNDGVQQAKGRTGTSLPPGVGFDILSDGAGGNTAYLLAGGTLHTVDLGTGQASPAGAVMGLPGGNVMSLAAMR